MHMFKLMFLMMVLLFIIWSVLSEMCQEYLLVMRTADKGVIRLSFRCSKRQIDKVFYSLAFASANSSIVCARLFCVVRDNRGNLSGKFAVNSFRVGDSLYRLVYMSESSRPLSSPFDPPHLEQYKNVQ